MTPTTSKSHIWHFPRYIFICRHQHLVYTFSVKNNNFSWRNKSTNKNLLLPKLVIKKLAFKVSFCNWPLEVTVLIFCFLSFYSFSFFIHLSFVGEIVFLFLIEYSRQALSEKLSLQRSHLIVCKKFFYCLNFWDEDYFTFGLKLSSLLSHFDH